MSPNTGVLLASIVVPLVLLAGVIWFFMRGWKDDPDEQRWKRLAEQRKAQAQDDSGPKSSSDA